MSGKNFVTVPGVPRPTFVSSMTAIKSSVAAAKGPSDVPVGEKVAKVYPWLSGVKQIVSGVANTETKIVRAGYGSSAFVNNTDRLVKINEIRFFSIGPTDAVYADPPINFLQIATRMGLKVRHTDFEIVSDWLPSGMLAVQNARLGAVARSNLCFSLPTPYYLQVGHSFRMRLRMTTPYNEATDYTLWLTLFGKDPRTNKIYELCKQVTIPYRTTPVVSDANPQYVDVVFDEDRDYPQRDLLLSHIGFTAEPYDTTNRVNVFQFFSQIDFQLIAPEGPKWMDFADWVPVANLVDQSTTLLPHCLVIYAPKQPILFEPSQQIDIDVRANVVMSYLAGGQRTVFEIPLWVSLIGTQEQKVGK